MQIGTWFVPIMLFDLLTRVISNLNVPCREETASGAVEFWTSCDGRGAGGSGTRFCADAEFETNTASAAKPSSHFKLFM
jgi:hypothetical protein